MKKLISAFLIALTMASVPAFAQGSLSSQVLRLLTRVNTWSAQNTFTHDVGVTLERGAAPSTTTDRIYNVGGALYFNGTLIPGSPGAATVTSVGMTVPGFLSLSGSPITTSGTLAVTLATQNQNKVFAGPTSGADATPTFRTLVVADIPDLSATYVTPTSASAFTNKTGNISQWTNNSGYITNSVATLASLTSLGTVTTGTWNGTLIAGQYGGTGVNNTGKTITLGGNVSTASTLTTAGSFALTLTTTGATNVTLPTSGTLITSSITALSSLTSVGTIATGVWQGTTVGAGFGGTGLASYTTGDILYASGATALSKLSDVATGNVLLSGGVGVAPSWGKVSLTAAVSGILPAANGGLGSGSAPTNGQLPIGNGANFVFATLTGTANQVTVTNGAGTITLSTPQSIATASTPQFARLGLGTGAGAAAAITTATQLDLGYNNVGNCGASSTINWNSGEIQKVTLNAATCTVSMSNPISGRTYRLDVIQDGTGGRLVTWPGTVTWKGGVAPTLTATASKTDICYFRWNGAAYLSNCDLLF